MSNHLSLFFLIFVMGCASHGKADETLPKRFVPDESQDNAFLTETTKPSVRPPAWDAYGLSSDMSQNQDRRLVVDKANFLVISRVKRLGIDECREVVANPRSIEDQEIRAKSVKACTGLIKQIDRPSRTTSARRKVSQKRAPQPK